MVVLIIGILITAVAIASIYIVKEKMAQSDINANPSNVQAQAIKITYDNLASTLSRTNMIRDLPDDAVILLQFYNFNSGERAIEKSYVLTQGEIKEGTTDNEDILIYIASKYLEQLTTANFCSIVQEAKSNGDLGIELKSNKVSLAWKYKSMMKYKSCLGL